jgi:hypothetical protein
MIPHRVASQIRENRREGRRPVASSIDANGKADAANLIDRGAWDGVAVG